MSAIRKDVQRNLFQSDDERLQAIVHATKVDGKKKKRPTFFCLAVTLEHPISVRLYVVKGERDEIYKKKERHNLRDIREVDGINPKKVSPDFRILIGDRRMLITAASAEEKDEFIRELYRLSAQYLPDQMPDFFNVALPVDTKEDGIIAIDIDDDSILSTVRNSVELIKEKDSLSVVERKNKERFREQLQALVAELDAVTDAHIKVLKEARLDDAASIARCAETARTVSHFWHYRVPVALLQMKAYQDRNNKLDVIDMFIDRLMSHFSALFKNLNELNSTQDWHHLSIPKQSQRFRALSPLAELMNWLKTYRPIPYNTAIQKYVESMNQLYHRLLSQFFTAINGEIQQLGNETKFNTLSPKGVSDRSHADYRPDSHQISKLIETVLGELGTVVAAEQKFCIRFFHINSELIAQAETASTGSGDSSSIGSRNLEKYMNEQVRTVVMPLMKSVEDHLKQFAENLCHSNHSNVLMLFVILSRKVLSHQDSGSIISMILGSFMVSVKRLFDGYMDTLGQSLREVKLHKRTRIGIIPAIQRYAEFVKNAENVFDKTDRRTDLEKWYALFYENVAEGIYRHSEISHSKSPPSVVRFENYHQLYSTLYELKVPCLDSLRKSAKQQRDHNISQYVNEYLGHPMDRLQLFVDDFSKSLSIGGTAKTKSFTASFSYAELKKVIALYPAKVVKKGLEELYKKVEKHLMENSSLLQVVWSEMQKRFISRFWSYQRFVEEGYPGSIVRLSVTTDEVLAICTEITRRTMRAKDGVRLCGQLQDFVAALDAVTDAHMKTLEEVRLDDAASIARCAEAARAVSHFWFKRVPKALLQMNLYQEINNRPDVIDMFIDRLMSHFSALFKNLNELNSTQDWHHLSIPKQSQRFRALSPLAELMNWLKTNRPIPYNTAIQKYVESTNQLYHRLFSQFFTAINGEIQQLGNEKKSNTLSPKGVSDRSHADYRPDSHLISQLIETVLAELGPVIEAEQKFSIEFFHIETEIIEEAMIDPRNFGGFSSSFGGCNVEQQVNDQVRTVVMPVMKSVEDHLKQFAENLCHNNPNNVITLFVILSREAAFHKRFTISEPARGFIISEIFGSFMVSVKRLFDGYMDTFGQSLKEVELHKKTRIGIIPSVLLYSELIKNAEHLSEEMDWPAGLQERYALFYKIVADGICRHSESSYSKSPPSVVRLENYHQLYSTLCELKVPCLDSLRKSAKQQRDHNISQYVRESLGKPLENLEDFLMSMKRSALLNGLSVEEIGSTFQFNCYCLKEVIKQYPSEFVKKGLEELYKKAEKHLMENSSLLQVVWKGMQEQFIKQLQDYQKVISECYAGSKVELDVSIDQVLGMFSEIAQQY